MKQELTEDDLEVAEASVRFAMENCPVEGLLSKEDGSSVSLDELQVLLERLEETERTPGLKLGGNVLMTLRSVIDYTSENCPVEGVATFHDGRPISGRSIMSLDEKLRSREVDSTEEQAATP
jgi:hypothetical protein